MKAEDVFASPEAFRECFDAGLSQLLEQDGLGAFILVPLSEILRGIGGLRIVFYGFFLVVFIVALPEGIFHYVQSKYHQFERWVEVE